MGTQYGHAVVSATIQTDRTRSDRILIAGAKKVFFEVPTAEAGLYTATCNIYCQVCDCDNVRYRRLVAMGIYSAGSGLLEWETPSNNGNFFVEVPVAGFNSIRVESRTSANSTTFQIQVHMALLGTL